MASVQNTTEKNQDSTPTKNTTESRLQTRLKFWHFVGTEEENLQKQIHEKRLESLRKELVGLKSTEWQYDPISKHIATPTVDSIDKELHENSDLAETYRQKYNEEHSIENTIESNEEISTEQCIKRRGLITSLNSEGGMLDRELTFCMNVASNLQLNNGQTVSYLTSNDENGQIKVRKIVEIIRENWNEGVTDEAIQEVRQHRPEVFSTWKVRKMGFITHRRKDRIVVDVDDEEITFSLDDIEATFVPQKFDRVSLDCVVQRDPQLVTEVGSSLTVLKMNPLINQQFSGEITFVEENEHCKINGNIIFFWDALTDDYRVVNVGDQVKADCIESESNDFDWRGINVVLVKSAAEKITDNSRLLEEKNNETKNQNGIVMPDGLIVNLNGLNETKQFNMMIKNTSDVEYKVIQNVFLGRKTNSQLTLVSPSRSDFFFLKCGEEKEYIFKATSKYFGDATEKFYIQFVGPTGQFKFFQTICISVYDAKQTHRGCSTSSNVQRNFGRYNAKKIANRDISRVIPGEPLKKRANFVKYKFGEFKILDSIKNLVLDTSLSSDYIDESLYSAFPSFNESITTSSYTLTFHRLLHLEECEMLQNIRKYDTKSFFTREREFLSLKVENIAESRPSIVLGDYIIATSPWSKDDRGHQGVIHEVKHDRILLKFKENFQSNYKNEDYEITFYFSRTPLRKQHHAIELAKKMGQSILFPSKIRMIEKQVDLILNLDTAEMCHCGDGSVIPWFNPSLNIVQKHAVANILQGVARPTPYVIFGPPGTGKTVTLIEIILQIIKNVPHSRILVATPSNSSANLITQRISESGILQQGEFIRLVSENLVQKELIPDDIIRYCGTIDIAIDGTEENSRKVTESGLTINCNVKYLKYHRLLIGTCITLGTLMQLDFPEGHFTHVIVDESGQCLETEVMIPITFVDKQIGQVILAGDPMQLGPIVLSRYASKHGLSQSYLDRILETTPYKPDPERFKHRYDPRLVTKLVYNYRSLRSIMKIYSDLFYDKDLKAMVNDTDSIESGILKKLAPILPNYGVRDVTQGAIFIGVEGKSETCIDSPSWLNRAEANNVFHFLLKLLSMGYVADDIGIITPYTQQVKTIRALIQAADILPPKVGTVEEFQGQERKIILLSTVRTVRNQLDFDEKHFLGFVKSPKRMNVAISRARALLVIFGSPKLLCQDVNWRFLIQHCIKNKSSINCDPALVGLDDNEGDD